MRALKFFFALTFLLIVESAHSEFILSGKEARIRVTDPSAQLIVNTQMTGFGGTLQCGFLRANQIQGRGTIGFSNGAIEASNYTAAFSGVFDPLNSDFIRLTGNHVFSVASGLVPTPIIVSGAGNILQGAPLFGSSITLTNTVAALTVALSAPLNQPIILNGGTITLGSDLDLVQAGILRGRGFVDGSGYVMRLNETAMSWTDTVTFRDLGQLQLRGTTTLSSVWTFSSGSGISTLDGENNTLDISSGGTLFIAPGNELVLINLTLRGLGRGYGSIVFGNAQSKLTLIGCTIVLSSRYSFSLGTVTCRDVSSLVIVGADTLEFIARSLLIVDGVQLVFDALSALNTTGISADASHLTLWNGGKVLARIQDENGPAMLFTHQSNVLLKSESLSPSRTMSFSVFGADTVSLDGRGFSLRMPQVKKSVISVADGQTLVLTNVVLDGFYPEHVSFGVGGRLVFGDNTFVVLAGDSTLTYSFNFMGNAALNGSGSVLSLVRPGALVVAMTSTLNIADITIKGIGVDSGQLVLQGRSSAISCGDSVLQFDSNYNFTTGSIGFSGSSSTLITGPNIISFTGESSLVVDGVSLFYDTLGAQDLHNIRPWIPDGALFVSRHGGRISSLSSAEREGDLMFDVNRNIMTQSESLSPSHRIMFRGMQAAPGSLELDGSGFVMQMPRSRSDVIVVPDGKAVVLKNMVLRDFAPEHICLGVNSSIVFGDGVVLQLLDDCVLPNLWQFSGNAVIDGRYKKLDFRLSPNARIGVNSGGNLKIVNTNIVGLSGAQLFGNALDAGIQLYSSTLQLDDDVVFSSGCLDIYNDVLLVGSGKTFSFTSTGTMTIHRGAQLYVDSTVVLAYDSLHNPSGFVFEDPTARLFLQNATLQSGSSGLALHNGTAVIGGVSSLKSTSTVASGGMRIGNDMDVRVQLGATLDIAGMIVYG